ncbi:MAG: hypothetical protein ACM30I_08990 [Gemmatimonas sp.]
MKPSEATNGGERRRRSADGENRRDVTRVQLDLSPRSLQRLRTLKDHREAISYAEVIREALKLYEFLVLEDEKGTSFLIQKPGEPPFPIKLFL